MDLTDGSDRAGEPVVVLQGHCCSRVGAGANEVAVVVPRQLSWASHPSAGPRRSLAAYRQYIKVLLE